MTMTQQMFMRTRPLTMAPSAFTSSAAWRSDYRAWTYKGVVPPSMLVPLYDLKNTLMTESGYWPAYSWFNTRFYATTRAVLYSAGTTTPAGLPYHVLYSKQSSGWAKTVEITKAGAYTPRVSAGKDYFSVIDDMGITDSTHYYKIRTYRWDGTLLWTHDVSGYDVMIYYSQYTDRLFYAVVNNYGYPVGGLYRLDPETGAELAVFTAYDFYSAPVFSQQYFMCTLHIDGESVYGAVDFDFNVYPRDATLRLGKTHAMTGPVTNLQYGTFAAGVLTPTRTIVTSDYPTIIQALLADAKWTVSAGFAFPEDSILLVNCSHSTAGRRIYRVGVPATGPLVFLGTWQNFGENGTLDPAGLSSSDGLAWYCSGLVNQYANYTVYADLAYVNDQYLASHPAIGAVL